jgi:hypothetical protein
MISSCFPSNSERILCKASSMGSPSQRRVQPGKQLRAGSTHEMLLPKTRRIACRCAGAQKPRSAIDLHFLGANTHLEVIAARAILGRRCRLFGALRATCRGVKEDGSRPDSRRSDPRPDSTIERSVDPPARAIGSNLQSVFGRRPSMRFDRFEQFPYGPWGPVWSRIRPWKPV